MRCRASAINAISVVFALIANLDLSFNMARRIRFETAQPMIIVGWYISSAFLIAILIPFGVGMYKPENNHRVYSQCYYYGAFTHSRDILHHRIIDGSDWIWRLPWLLQPKIQPDY